MFKNPFKKAKSAINALAHNFDEPAHQKSTNTQVVKNNQCIICNKPIKPRLGRMYCSDACKQSAHYAKLKAGKMKEHDYDRNKIITVNIAEWLDFKLLTEQQEFEDEELTQFLDMNFYFFVRLMFNVPYERQMMRLLFEEFWHTFYDKVRERNSNLNIKLKQFSHMVENHQVVFVSTDFKFMPKVEYTEK
jgi:hypothetical protein